MFHRLEARCWKQFKVSALSLFTLSLPVLPISSVSSASSEFQCFAGFTDFLHFLRLRLFLRLLSPHSGMFYAGALLKFH
jgi:hypothetical protein